MSSQIHQLIGSKNYAKAIDLIKGELQRRPRDARLRIWLCDAYIGANRNREAITELMSLADDHAADGFTAKAIAVLKRIDKIEPGRQDVEERLAKLVQEKVSRAPTPVSRPAMPEFGFEEIDTSQEFTLGVGPASASVPDSGPSLDISEEPALEITAEPALEIAAGPPLEISTDDEDLEGLNAITIEEPVRPTSATQQARSFLQTPLFEGFAQDELAAIIRGLRFIGFEPGDILVGDGAPGDSMYIIAAGTAKIYVRDMKGGYMKIGELSEGEFFGEVSVLTGKPRTATITAETDVEVLELDKPTLDSIIKKYPRVKQVLHEYQAKRAEEAVAAIVRHKE